MTSNRSVSEMVLKPCPFCGEPARVDKTYPHINLPSPWFVSVDHLDSCELATVEESRRCHGTRMSAVKCWNTRASSQAQSDDVDAAWLRAIAEQILDGNVLGVDNATRLQNIADRLAAIPPAGGVEEKARAVINAAFTSYRKADGSLGTIEGDDGEMCFIVPNDEMTELRATLNESSAIGGGDGR